MNNLNLILGDYISNSQVKNIEDKLSSILFTSEEFAFSALKQYTSIIVSGANTQSCFFRVISGKQRSSTTKNFECNRTCGAGSISVKSYLKERGIYKRFVFLLEDCGKPMMPITLAFMKTLEKSQKLYFLRFHGNHSFESKNPCLILNMKPKTTHSLVDNKLIFDFTKNQNQLQNFCIIW
ncbi:Hypothetical_protein [Hexamita inflata]|uniref:Hypothetical_protein n=1 Tax=Hexamita inflata TaxID=28002 RepID=A0AA86P6L0_9EUKA|nr:Hypothetical protein HINF_LOCUS19316 [Hexamita inflata]